MYWQATPCADSIVSSLQYGHEHTTLAEPINSDVTSLCDVTLHIAFCCNRCVCSSAYHM